MLSLELLGPDEDEPMMSMLVRPMDAENNSVAATRVNVGTEPNKTSSFTSATTETQTQTSRYFGYEDIDSESHHESMDIETQTSSAV